MAEVEYYPYDREIQYDPYPCWKRLRDEAPVYHNPEYGFWALSRYEDVANAFLDPVTFISGEGVTFEGTDKGSRFLISTDDPEHQWHRKLLSRVFTPRRVADLEPFIRDVAAKHLDALRGRDRVDIVQEFSRLLPLEVISELIGLPQSARERITALSMQSKGRDADHAKAGEVSEASRQATIEQRIMFMETVADRRRHPGDDVISMLIASEATDDDGNRWHLDDDVIAAQMQLLAVAGHETVMGLIAHGLVALAQHPDQRDELVADPGLIPGAVEEMLRWDNPAPLAGRWCTRDVEIAGTTIPARSRVMLLMGSANRDERRYPDADRFDIHRVTDRPLVFGFGPHLCLGASLARLESRIAFEELLARFPAFEVDEAGIDRGPPNILRPVEHLPFLPNA